jgi:hypothetical protein
VSYIDVPTGFSSAKNGATGHRRHAARARDGAFIGS